MELKDTVHNPHDGFFKELMGNKEVAVDFFKNYLPPDILKLINIKTLQIKKDSFIEKRFKQFYSDILYQVAIRDRKAYIYLLFEHQSSPDRWIALRLLGYIKLIWELALKQEARLKLLPPIIPLVLYHGKDKWNIGGKLSDIIHLGDKEELRLYLPDFAYILYNLSAYSDKEIKGQILTRICLDLFKHIFDPDLGDHLRKIAPLLRELLLGGRTGLESIERILRYVANASDISLDELTNILETVSKETGGMVMSLAATLEKKGIQKGIQKGMEKGKLIGSIRTAQLIKGLSGSDEKELEKLSVEELEGKLEELTKK